MKSLRLPPFLTGAWLVLSLGWAPCLVAQAPAEDAPPPAVQQVEDEHAAPPPAPPAPEAPGDDESVQVEATDDAEVADDFAAQFHRSGRGERVGIGSDVLHEADSYAQTVVAIMADAIVDGEVGQEAVVVLGDLTLNGSAREAVNVLGHLTLNGEVHGDVVAVLTSVDLGPDAHVHGDFVSVGGAIQRAPGARIDGDVQEIPFMGDMEVHFDWLKAWVKNCLLWGRPLWFGENLGWAWMLMGAALMFYLFIALVVPGPVKACARTMENHPGYSLLTAVLSFLLMPLLLVVLAVTGIGPALLALVMFFVGLFGKAVFLAWLGRRFAGDPERMAAPLAVLLGGLVTVVIYLIPIAGFAFQQFSGFLGTGIVIYAMIEAMQSGRGKAVPPPAPTGPGSAAGAATAATAAAAGTSAATTSGSAETTPPPVPPPVQTPPPPAPPPLMGSAGAGHGVAQWSTLPRAGFWTRLGATLLDVILLAIVLNVLETSWWRLTDYFFAWVGIYHVLMWGLKGTTVGGIVFGLKVVRLDDRPMDWSIAIVRGLASYISLFVIGLGFAWVAFDPDRQSWHDKIAGTTIVRVPKGFSLI